MFDTLLQELIGSASGIQEREEGVAFLKVAKTLHPLTSIVYLGFNISIGAARKRYAQCTYSDRWAKQCVSLEPLNIERIQGLAWALREPLDWRHCQARSGGLGLFKHAGSSENDAHILSFPVRPVGEEAAFFCVRVDMPEDDWTAKKPGLLRELRILAGYFHHHILRIHGHDTENAILVSARELDCLKWIAAGKTAWEASVILGISERTVRFHLNAAREKLDCLTTTQAVAKAVSQQLI